MRYRYFEDYEEYAPFIPQIGELFTAAFDKPFDRPGWENTYRPSVYGPSRFLVEFDGDKVIAHQALIEARMEGPDGRQVPYQTAASLMISPNHRGPSSYYDMMLATEEAAADLGSPFIFGFPNQQATKPLKYICRWTPLRESPLMAWRPDAQTHPGEPVVEADSVPRVEPSGHPWDETYREWKFGKGTRQIAKVGPISLAYRFDANSRVATIFEAHSQDINRSEGALTSLAAHLGAEELRLTQHFADAIGLRTSTLVPHAGYVFRLFAKSLGGELPDVSPSLLLSEVF